MQTDLPSITVIVPCFNGARFLQRTLDSVLAQSYPAREVIVVDDGSTDDSLNILNAYGPAIQVLRHPNGANKGQAASLNLGIANSHSDLIAFLDADDCWYPEKLEHQAAVFAKQAEIGLVYSNGEVVDENDKSLYPILEADFVPPANPDGILLNCYIRTPSMVMVRRTLMEQVGGFTLAMQSMDHEMWVRCGEVTPFYFLNESLIAYRQHGGQQSLRRRQWEDGFKILADASVRYPYSGTTRRHRRAVIYYRLGEYDLKHGRYAEAAYEFLLAFLFDPRRALRQILHLS